MNSSPTDTPNPQDERITELEIKVSFNEDLLDSLNLTLYRQQERIQRLEAELQALRQLMVSNLPTEQLSLRDEIPPHY